MKRVLVLRPEPGASATAKRARERGLEPLVIPLFKIEPVEWEVPEAAGFDGLLLTSANAVRCAGDKITDLRGLPVYAVGAATGEAAREAGFDVKSVGDAGVERLLGSIEADLRLLHLVGEDRKVPDARQQITEVTFYRSQALDGVDLAGARDAVALIHSPRAGARLAELLAGEKGTFTIAAISAEAAEAAGSGWAGIEIAEAPSDEALLALTERLCNNMPAQ
jgi:uroporphyrinogen-III synthase